MDTRVFVVSGPSGVGKTTLIDRALREVAGVYFGVSATTRPRREGEVDGRDYHFVSDETFDDLLRRDEFIEWEEVYGNRYGTLKSEAGKAADTESALLLELDVKGALNVKSQIKDVVLIFIAPPSLKDLEYRLQGREGDEEGNIEFRRNKAPEEIKVGQKGFDIIVVNDDVDRAAGELASVLRGEKG